MTKLVYIDPGHGGQDSGAVGNDLREKEVVLDISQRLQKYLETNYVVDCRLSRTSDRTLALSARTKEANNLKASCLVSIHINAATDKAANGFESFVYTTDGPTSKSVELQQKLHQKLAPLWTGKGRKDRGKKKENFHMVREFKGAAVLLEFGFITNKQDADLLKDDQYLQSNASSAGEAIASYLSLPSKTEQSKNIYRVIVDGNQVGAYAEVDNVLDQAKKAVKAGKADIKLSLT